MQLSSFCVSQHHSFILRIMIFLSSRCGWGSTQARWCVEWWGTRCPGTWSWERLSPWPLAWRAMGPRTGSTSVTPLMGRQAWVENLTVYQSTEKHHQFTCNGALIGISCNLPNLSFFNRLLGATSRGTNVVL